MDKLNLNKPKKNSSIGIIIAIFFVFGLIGNLAENLGNWGDFLIVFLIFGIAIFSMVWKYKKLGFKEMMMKNGGNFRNAIKSMIEEEKKKQENKLYNIKKTINENKIQDIDILNEKKWDNYQDNDFIIHKEGENLKNKITINNLNLENEFKDLKFKNIPASKALIIFFAFVILPILVVIFVNIFLSITDGNGKPNINLSEILNQNFIGYGNSNIVWIIVFVLLVFVIGFGIYNYRKKPLKK